MRAVEIPKRDGSPRVLGVPTVADRIAQTVVRGYLEPGVEPLLPPGLLWVSAGAVGAGRGRGLPGALLATGLGARSGHLKSFFDSVPHDLVLKAVAHHTDQRWVLLYVERWLKAPLQREDGSLIERDRGTPQGSAISPLLANMFLHYAFDAWMARELPGRPVRALLR